MTPVIEVNEPSSTSNLPQRLWNSEVHDSRIAAELRGTKENRCLLAGVQVSGARHDLSAGQSFAQGIAEARAH